MCTLDVNIVLGQYIRR